MIDPLALGATLYMPATRTDLAARAYGGAIPGLRSCVVCLEDSVRIDEVPQALANLHALLAGLPESARAYIFVRPRDPAMLAGILCMPGADRLAGFVLPKVTPETLPLWLCQALAPSHCVMPTLETREAFDAHEMHRLRDQLLAVQDRVPAIRIGGNDLLQCLGLRRAPHRTLYEGPLGTLVATLAGMFLPHGFALSAPVMESYDDPQLLRVEFTRDLEHGLTSKTAIHPVQLPVIHAALAVSSADLAEAGSILSADAPAVFGRTGRMCEPATHRRWAEAINQRALLYGVADPLPIARQA
jgi:citrate lyase beta subunit